MAIEERRIMVFGLVAILASGCGWFSSSPEAVTSAGARVHSPSRKPVVEMPWDTTVVRDDSTEPILKVVTLDDGKDGLAVPYLYGYPLHASSDAVRGILKLRTDNYEDATREDVPDKDGVVHRVETLPKLGCVIEGVRETETKFVPRSILCDVPAPADLGGSDRPVVGTLKGGVDPQAVVDEPSLKRAFLGDWHLVEGELADGTGYFNTADGQVAFAFEGGALKRVGYYFDPPQKGWRQARLWVRP